MTRSMRPRFSEPPPPRRPPQDDERRTNFTLSWIGQFLALVLVCGMAYLAYYWLTSDISGEYQGINPYIGTVRLTLLRRPVSLDGDITYARLAPLSISPASTISENHLALQFSQSPDSLRPGAKPRSASLTGDIKDGQITGVVQEQGYAFNVTLNRTSLSSLQQQLQAHLPF